MVVCWVIGSGGVWLSLPPAEARRRALAGEVQVIGDPTLITGEPRHGKVP